MMKMNKCLAILFGLAISGSAMAVNWDWDGGEANTSWTNRFNWKNNQLYGSSDTPLFRPGDFATMGVGESYDGASSTFRLGQDGTGTSTVHIVGGDLTIKNNTFIGYRSNSGANLSVGVMVVSNGSFTVGNTRDLSMGNGASAGILDMHGGTVTVTRNLILNNGGGTSIINLYDGYLDVNGVNRESGANIEIYLESGLWEIGGDNETTISNMVAAGEITGDGSNGGAVVSTYTLISTNIVGDVWWSLAVDGANTNTLVYTFGVAGEADISLNPSTQLAMDLVAPATVSTGTVDVSFTYGSGSNNVFITGVSVDNAAFTRLDTGSFPLELTSPTPSNETLSIQYDNAVGNLTNDQQTSSGTISVIWKEGVAGAAQTNELPVVLTYQNTPASVSLDPSDILQLIIMSPDTSATEPVNISYIESTVNPTNVTISSIAISNATHAGFSVIPSSLTLDDPEPSNEVLSVSFDATTAGLSTGESASGDLVVIWNETGKGITYTNTLPVYASYLAPATGVIEEWETTLPTNNIAFDGTTNTAAAVYATRQFAQLGQGYSKMYQEIDGSELTGVTDIDGLLLKMRFTANLSGSSGANQLQIWFGKINTADGTVASTLATETFDCSDQVFTIHKFYQFKLSAPISFDPADLGAGEAYGYQVWWTSDDADNSMAFWRANIDAYAGRANVNTGVNTTFPVTMSSTTVNRDLICALASGLSHVNSVGDVSVVGLDGSGNLVMGWVGEAGGTYAVQRADALGTPTIWSNVIENITGVGPISVTNDTTDPKAFYRTILQ